MSSRNWPHGQILLIMVAGLPVAASFCLQSSQRTPQTPAATAMRPALAFDQYLVNLGELHNTPRADAHFSFKNCGKSPARIVSLEPSCGCLSTKIEKRAYQPNEICDFALRVLTTHQPPGPHDYSLTINYEDPQPRKATVALKLVVRREVTLNPPQLLFYQNGRDPGQRDVMVTDMRPTPFRVTGASCKSQLVKVTVKEPIDDPDGGRETSVSITVAANCPAEGETALVYLYTDDPRYPRIQIPVWIREMKLSGIQQTSGQQTAVGHPQVAH